MISRREAVRDLGIAGASMLFRSDGAGQNSPFRFADHEVDLIVSTISLQTVRLTLIPRGTADPLNEDGALVDFPEHTVRHVRAAEYIAAGDFSINVKAHPLSVAVANRQETVQEIEFHDISGQIHFSIASSGDAPLLGLGEGGPQFDRRGAHDKMQNGQGGYRLRTHGGRVPIQWLIGTQGWGLYIHQPLGEFDLSGPGRGIFTSSDPLPVDIFVVVSHDPVIIMREYARITGLPAMPALWTLGYQQSHRTLAGPEEVMRIARTLREKKLPCDALIYLGTDFTPSGWNSHNGEFTWNAANFPNPQKTIDDLHARNFKVVLHAVIEGRHLTGTVKDPCAAPEPSGRTPDGKWPDERSVGCYWPHHKRVFDLGIDGWWPDQGDGLDAPSRLNRIRMYWEGSRMWRPNERPYALHRNGYAGMARYGAFLWSGDVYSTWETLRTHVPVAINTGLSGIPYWGTDIGGFVPTPEFTGELYVRWFQFGAFCPLFRAHGRTWHLRLPWGWNTGELGPNETSTYPDAGNPPESELHNAQVEPICRKYLELRYGLIPYLYSTVRQTSLTGLPIMRALWLHHADDPVASACADEYLWGRDILVAPVTEKGASARRVYLPRGTWYDFWTNEKVQGGREINRTVDLETMPLYVRAGAIVPFGPVKQYAAEKAAGPLTMVIYPGADGAFDLFEDDGRSFDYERGAWMGVQMRWSDIARRLTVSLARGSRLLPPAPRDLQIRLAGSDAGRTIRFDGRLQSVPLRDSVRG
ncbi:MAG: glycoside hydrolase [Acidobacteria bacterium]|nr:MAG: glycoside hydrolase [Acidobacteriota bacterium]